MLLIVSVLSGLGIARDQYALMLIPPLTLLVALLSRRQSHLLFLILVAAFLTPALLSLPGTPPVMRYSSDLLVLLFIVAVATRSAIDRSLTLDKWLLPYILFVLVIGLLAGQWNLYSMQSLLGYVLLPLFAIALQNLEIDRAQRVAVLKALGFLVLAQIPVALLQKVMFYSDSFDRIGGTLGRAGTTFMGVLMASAVCFAVAAAYAYKKKRILLLLPLLMLPMILGEVKAGFLLAAVGILVIAVVFGLKARSFRPLVFTAAIAVVPLAVAFAVYSFVPWLVSGDPTTGEFGLRFFRDPGIMLQYVSGFGRSTQANRLEVLRIILQRHSELSMLLLGRGPGFLSTSTLLTPASSQAMDAAKSVFGWITSGGRHLLEIGLIGLLLYVCGVLSVAFRICKRLRNSEDPLWLTLKAGLVGAAIVFLLGGFYTSAWHFEGTAVSFWLLVGLVLVPAEAKG